MPEEKVSLLKVQIMQSLQDCKSSWHPKKRQRCYDDNAASSLHLAEARNIEHGAGLRAEQKGSPVVVPASDI